MSDHCCPTFSEAELRDKRYKRILWAALVINGGMFIGEMVAGIAAGSSALQADALDFLGDTANYGISLIVATMALHIRAKAALLKGLTMAIFGVWVLGATSWHAISNTLPEAETMGIVGAIALLANFIVLLLLWAYRTGDSNMRSVWLCSRNDVIGNLAVLLAAAGVFGTNKGWPDLVVAAIMGILALQGAIQVIRHARDELAQPIAS